MKNACLRVGLAGLIWMGSLASVWAAPQLWKLETRHAEDGKPVTLPVLVDQPEVAIKGVLIALDTGNNKSVVKEDKGVVDYGQPTTVIARTRRQLLEKGIAVLTPGTPSDRPDGINFAWREGLEHRRDIEVLVAEARKRFPGVPVVVHGYFIGATSVLMLARARTDGIDGYVITSGMFSMHRDDSFGRIKARGLVIQPVSHRCDEIPTPEAREVAAAAHWQFVEAGDSSVDAVPRCTTNSRAGLVGLDDAFADLLARWILEEPVPSTFGKSPVALAYNESVFRVPSATRGLFGKYQIEVSLFTPPGKGPFPVLVFNHGDVGADTVWVTRHVRYRDMFMVNEFLALGFAVALPARPGVGRSEGIYQNYMGARGVYIGPATGLLEKGKDHAEEALAALDYLRTLPQLDTSRIVMSGQSAGGFAVSCLGLINPRPDWLKAIVNFSGGRTDTSNNDIARGLNPGMVDAFRLLGQATKVPALWIFAENDSRYSAETIRASYEAYTKAGGEARLLLYPPSKDDGHFVYHEPAKWRGELRVFLEQQGLVKPLPAKKPAPAPEQSVVVPAPQG